MRERPRVVALMPAWRAASFIEGPLNSLAAQTYSNLHILISDDASPDGTADLCEAFAERHRNTRVIRQLKNLGWVGNLNALLSEAEGDYFLFSFHDDELKPTCVERLVQALQANPNAVLSFSDLEVHYLDGRVDVEKYTALAGARNAYQRGRQLVLREGKWWVPMRGLFPAQVAKETGGLSKHPAGDFGADWLWLLRLGLLGEFARVPEVLAVKHYLKGGLTSAWKYSVWQRSGLLLGGMRTLRNAGLPLGDELRLQPLTLLSSAARWLSKSG